MTLLAEPVPAIGADSRPRLVEIARDLEPAIRAAEASIENRVVPEELTNAFYDQGIYRAFMPRELGGLEVHPLEWLEAVEEVSRINGSMGWLCMLHTGATFAAPEVMRPILARERWIIAGNIGRAAGKAVKVDGGYRISGRWPFNSGSPEANYCFGRSVLYDEHDEPVVSWKDGLPLYLVGYFPAKDVIKHDTWDGLGLRGTGSGDIEVKDLFVPREMVNEAGIWRLRYDRALYRGPFNLMAHGAHALGLATAAVDEYVTMVNRAANRGSVRQKRLGTEQQHQIAVGKATALIRAARLLHRDAVGAAYENAQQQRFIDYELRVRLHQSNLFAVHSAKQAVQLVYEQAGSIAVFRGQPLERIFRDMTVAGQHIIVNENSYDRIGQYLLTKDLPGGPQIDIEGGFIAGPHPRAHAG